MHIFHGNLEAIKTPGFSHLDFLRKSFNQILVNYSVRSGKKGQDVWYKMFFRIFQFLPIWQVLWITVKFKYKLNKRLTIYAKITFDRSTSSTVQKEASAFLYICQISGYWIGKTTKRLGLSFNNGSNSGLKVVSSEFVIPSSVKISDSTSSILEVSFRFFGDWNKKKLFINKQYFLSCYDFMFWDCVQIEYEIRWE